MSRISARIALLLALLAVLPASPVGAADGPAGQFLPSKGDRDGDGLPDAADCAADDPTRPARSGADLDCDGASDHGGGVAVEIAGPVDGGPDPGDQEAASRPSEGTVATEAAARRAAGDEVVAVPGLRLGRAVAVYEPARATAPRPAVVVVAKDNAGVTVRATIVFSGRRRALAPRTRSLTPGRALVVRVRAPAAAQRIRFAFTVVDAQGGEHRAVRTVRLR